MDLHQLRVFREAARTGSFTRSSERLHLSQSTISLHIKKLEDELGVPLFLRARRRVQLSEAGVRLLPYADRIIQELRNADMAVKELGEMECGAIRLGSGGTTLTYVLPKVLRAFQTRYPQIELIVTTGSSEALAQAVHRQMLDLAIVMQPVQSSLAIEVIPVVREELVYVVASGHKLAAKSALDPKDILEAPMIAFLRGSTMQSVVDRYFRAMGVTPRVTMEMENSEAIKALVRAGLGAAVLPLCCVAGSQKSGIHALRIRNFPIERSLAVALPKSAVLPRAVEKFATHMTKALSGKTVAETRANPPRQGLPDSSRRRIDGMRLPFQAWQIR